MIIRPARPLLFPGILLFLLFSLYTINTSAINLMFLSKEAPARRYSDEDWQYLNRAIDHTLVSVEDGASYRWNNPASPASGLLEVLESSMRDGTSCRRMRLTNFYDDIRGVTEFVFCKQSDGEWKVSQ